MDEVGSSDITGEGQGAIESHWALTQQQSRQ